MQQLQVANGFVVEAADFFTQARKGGGQCNVGKFRWKVLQAFIKDIELFDQAAHGFDAFVQTRLAAFEQGFTQGLNRQIGAVDNTVDGVPGIRSRGHAVFVHAQIARQGHLQEPEVAGRVNRQAFAVLADSLEAGSPHRSKLSEPRLCVVQACDHVLAHLGQGLGVLDMTLLGMAGLALNLVQHGFKLRCERDLSFAYTGFRQVQLGADVAHDLLLIIRSRGKHIQDLELLQRRFVVISLGLELLQVDLTAGIGRSAGLGVLHLSAGRLYLQLRGALVSLKF